MNVINVFLAFVLPVLLGISSSMTDQIIRKRYDNHVATTNNYLLNNVLEIAPRVIWFMFYSAVMVFLFIINRGNPFNLFDHFLEATELSLASFGISSIILKLAIMSGEEMIGVYKKRQQNFEEELTKLEEKYPGFRQNKQLEQVVFLELRKIQKIRIQKERDALKSIISVPRYNEIMEIRDRLDTILDEATKKTSE